MTILTLDNYTDYNKVCSHTFPHIVLFFISTCSHKLSLILNKNFCKDLNQYLMYCRLPRWWCITTLKRSWVFLPEGELKHKPLHYNIAGRTIRNVKSWLQGCGDYNGIFTKFKSHPIYFNEFDIGALPLNVIKKIIFLINKAKGVSVLNLTKCINNYLHWIFVITNRKLQAWMRFGNIILPNNIMLIAKMV